MKKKNKKARNRNKKARNRNKHIKIKKIVKGLRTAGTGLVEREFWVQLTKDDVGMSLSIDDYMIPLEPLGIEIKEKK